jgi:hypothetical protein
VHRLDEHEVLADRDRNLGAAQLEEEVDEHAIALESRSP